MNYTEASSSTQTNVLNNDYYQCNMENWLTTQQNSEMIVAENQLFHPKNTTHTYLAKQKEWMFNLYQEFEAQLSGAIGESTKKFQVSDHIQVVAPEIAAAMQAQNQFEFANARSVGLETRNVLVETFLQASFYLCNDPSQI
ncbi:hypothetical protein PHYBLDRAFT_173463 [Phycomyces blakesleeanus NRRL 1555(-)]|uniref:Ndc10 domain-containing protein n=1 Tax=Phycomyces blakesleeanus (strain ATCC 8743b / DSM 1359 / FGSC 10004 / NBRC 33097 / NRRL 1555) TaxID=763407 RepID=A0A162TGU0_PHYB8|nr:hypothetical protein PHYBLDRAFT_173463 [Phycomyces blakesleeanus NRRL 1555(-)]OAD68472.1 hypothetical protein PHYBLDRAFT_173463 [Phycomyces blakesleeanus NRRL 1555(-)]|eukprot:XP_018286512.1 hypothetical protein PHYBLDRAFT_173463 [Phycomyces blakesleeanus NRRL 1555(-)]